jgi:succinate dehydrogenase flavin-adding protein (antitoxin of CptAB toxin-antitoxin module)
LENDLEDDDILYQIAEETENKQNNKNDDTNEHTSLEDDNDLMSLLDDDSNWEPWKDLPICSDVSSEESKNETMMN